MQNNKAIINKILFLFVIIVSFTSCKKFLGLEKQTDYDYVKQTLDPHINITARQFLETRSDVVDTVSVPKNVDTVFRWMKKGLDYAGIDLAEYEKSQRTFIFLHNDAIKQLDKNGKVTGGFFFTFPIIDTNASGQPIIDAVTGAPKTHPAQQWSDYKKETVKNYFLYLIGQGEYNFEQLDATNKPVQSILPANTVATKESLLGYLNDGKSFEPDSKFYLKIANNSDLGPIVINDKTNDRSAGYIATNGIVHVFGGTVYPFK
jgi:hypothetical protein